MTEFRERVLAKASSDRPEVRGPPLMNNQVSGAESVSLSWPMGVGDCQYYCHARGRLFGGYLIKLLGPRSGWNCASISTKAVMVS